MAPQTGGAQGGGDQAGLPVPWLLCGGGGGNDAVRLLLPGEADAKDAAGNFVWNHAWECTPDSDEAITIEL